MIKFDMNHAVADALRTMGLHGVEFDGRRIDANETAMFARSLEHIFAELYEVEYPDLKARALIPVKAAHPGAESHTFREVEKFGQAKIVHNYSTDFPSAEVQGREFTQGIRSIGSSYQYSIQDMRAASLSGFPLEAQKAIAAREVIEFLLDDLALNGDANTGLKGWNSLAGSFNPVTKGTQVSGTTWLTATPDEILKDVRDLFKSVPENTKQKHRANTLVLDSASYNHIAFTERGGAASGSSQTLLTYIQANVPDLKSVEVWTKLDHAGATNKSRIFAYDRSPRVIYQVIPQDFEQFPPQARGLAFVVNCHLRWGGVVSPYPKAVSYMDGTGAAS